MEGGDDKRRAEMESAGKKQKSAGEWREPEAPREATHSECTIAAKVVEIRLGVIRNQARGGKNEDGAEVGVETHIARPQKQRGIKGGSAPQRWRAGGWRDG